MSVGPTANTKRVTNDCNKPRAESARLPSRSSVVQKAIARTNKDAKLCPLLTVNLADSLSVSQVRGWISGGASRTEHDLL